MTEAKGEIIEGAETQGGNIWQKIRVCVCVRERETEREREKVFD